MSWLSAIPIIGKIVDKGLDIIDEMVPDKDLAQRLKSEIKKKAMDYAYSDGVEELKAKKEIIVAEAQGGFLASNWRPITMLTFVLIISNNYILYPYLALFWTDAPMLTIPPDMWGLLKIGLGGYVVGRSAEKVATVLKNP